MEQDVIAALLEKYWQAETTVAEERQLADYFRQPGIPPEWEPWRNVFAYFEEEAQVRPGKDFESKLLQRIQQMEVEDGHSSRNSGHPSTAPAYALSRRGPWWAAAAVILIALGISRLGGPTMTPARSIIPDAAGTWSRAGYTNGGIAVIKDTYDDPQQALAAIQKALHIAAEKMNRGKIIVQKQMDRKIKRTT